MNVEFVPHKKITVNSTESGWLPDWQNGHRQLFILCLFIKNILIYNNRYVYGMWCNVSSKIGDLPARYRIYWF